MPLEIRRIEFTEIELRAALSLYQSKIEGGLANKDGGVSGVKVTGGDEFNIVAKVSCPRDGVVRKVFDHNTTLGVMVLYAKQASIPLPRKGRKVLSPTQFGGVAMTVRYDHRVCEPAAPSVNVASMSPKATLPAVAGHV
jgi:hypothetical protein